MTVEKLEERITFLEKNIVPGKIVLVLMMPIILTVMGLLHTASISVKTERRLKLIEDDVLKTYKLFGMWKADKEHKEKLYKSQLNILISQLKQHGIKPRDAKRITD